MERYERADLTLLARKGTSTSIHGFSGDDIGNNVETSVEQDRSAVYGALSLQTYETRTLESSMAGLMSSRAGETLRNIEKRDETKSQFIIEPDRMVPLPEYSRSNNDHTHHELKDWDDKIISDRLWQQYTSDDNAEEDEDQSDIALPFRTPRMQDEYMEDEDTEHEDMEDEDMEGEDTDALRVDLNSGIIAQSAHYLSGLNTTLDENIGTHALGRHHIHKLLASGAKQDSIFINCTISEDRSGDQESVTSMRLAALSLRGKVELHVPINDSCNGNSQIPPPSDTNSKRTIHYYPDAIEVSSARLYLGNLAHNSKFPFKPDSRLGRNSHADFGVATKSDIEAHFSSHPGKIVEIKLMKGFGFIEYHDAFDARDVVPGI